MSSKYNNEFYSSRHDQTVYSASTITSIVQDLIKPTSAVDLGCGVGTWLKVLNQNGVNDIFGLEGEWVKEEALVIPKEKFRKTDLSKPIELGRTFDLAISMEVAEHIDEKFADQFVDNLTNLAPVVLFSAAIPLQGGAHHVNEQWPVYWMEKFARRNYSVLDCIRPKVWNDPRITVWYAQNSLLFVRNDKFDHFPHLREYRIETPMLSVVHPRFFEHALKTLPPMKALRNRVKRGFSKS